MNKIAEFFDINNIKKYIPTLPNLNDLADWTQYLCLCFGQNQFNEINQIELYPAIRSCKMNPSDNFTEKVPVNETEDETIYDLNSDTESVIEEMIKKMDRERIIVDRSINNISPIRPISPISPVSSVDSMDMITPINSVVLINKMNSVISEPIPQPTNIVNSTDDMNDMNNMNDSNITIKNYATELIEKIMEETVSEVVEELVNNDMIEKINAEMYNNNTNNSDNTEIINKDAELENDDWKNDIRVILDYEDCETTSTNSTNTPKSSGSEYELV